MLINLAKLLKYEFRRFKGRSRLALFFVLIIPLLYGGVYLHANWDLYANTDDVPIAVVDLDEPTTFGDRTVDGGNQLEGQLKNRPLFDWRFMGTDSQAALDGLRAGDYYMVITIPKDFSKNLVSAGDYKPARATLQLRRDDANGFIIGLLTSQVETSLGKALDESVTQTYFESVFGNLQKITSEQLGLSPILMAAANSSGGVMGKMIDAQSIVVASTATGYFGQEGKILRFVFWHSIVLASLVGGLVMLQAYVSPFTKMVIHP